jgi:TonB family protein
MRASNRTYSSRGIALVIVVALHGMIIYLLATHKIAIGSPGAPPVLVTIIEQSRRPAVQLRIPALALTAPKLSPIATPEAAVEMPQTLAPQALLSGQDPDVVASTVASDEHGVPSGAYAAAPNLGDEVSGITVAHRVQPIYSDASVRAKEQGYVSVALLIDEHGRVRKVEVVKSSGFRRLDQSVVDALRQWTFARNAEVSRSIPAWTTFQYGFHLASSAGLDLSTISLTLVPYDPALAEQIGAAAAPVVAAQTPKPSGTAALRRLIAAIREVAPSVSRDFRGPPPPVQLVAKLGAVRSIQFLRFESRGLEFDEVKQVVAPPSRNSRESQWELYKVTQQWGESEWLIAVTRSGIITDAQALTCESVCPGF